MEAQASLLVDYFVLIRHGQANWAWLKKMEGLDAQGHGLQDVYEMILSYFLNNPSGLGNLPK